MLNFFSREKGQGLVEYAFILVLVVLLLIVLLWIFGDQLGATYSNIIDTI
jgi:Flp pilus assembly pilin Flp